MDLPREASQYILDGQAQPRVSQIRLQAVIDAAGSGLSLVDLVKSLRDYLIADSGDTRSRAALLLANVSRRISFRL